MDDDIADLPDDIDALKAALTVARAKVREVLAERDAGAAELAVARAKASEDLALIAHQKLRIAKLERQLYGPRSERSARLIDQLALQFEELEASATEDELAAEIAVAKTTTVAAFTRKRPERKTFPEHLPRERVVITPPTACECCGGTRLRKLGEDVTRTLEMIPRQWKVIETVRENFTCQDCEKISQAPAPFHVIPRGWAGANLLAMILFEKFGQHQPLNRQAERYAREGVPISLSTMADAVGAGCTALDPVLRLVEAHVLAAERLHGDDTTVPVLATGKTDTGRCWVYVRDDRPFGGRRRRRRCSIIPATAKASIRRAIWPGMPGCSRPTRLTDIASSIRLTEVPVASSRQDAGFMPAARSSSWPISRRTRDAGPRARRQSRSRPSRSRSCAASTRCSKSSGPSMANLRMSAEPFVRHRASRWSRRSGLHARTTRQALPRP